jgi:c-di-GMP-binding flagellar brake protein YcgR
VSKFNVEEKPDQGPVTYKEPIEVAGHLRTLAAHKERVSLVFEELPVTRHGYTVLLAVDRERGLIALDEVLPLESERHLLDGQTFSAEGYHEGVRMAWTSRNYRVKRGSLEGVPCFWIDLPDELEYHQRRDAYRAPLKRTQSPNVNLSGSKLSPSLVGKLLDISATGCKVQFPGNLTDYLQSGTVYERLSIALPESTLVVAVELRHLYFDRSRESSMVGLRFYQISGYEQRQIERYVFQLQRESRRLDFEDE